MRLTLEVSTVAHGGVCVARHEGRVVFVRHALPGEKIVAEIAEPNPDARLWRAEAIDILEASPERVRTPWPDAGPGGVGGGELGHVRHAWQREWKRRVITESFARFADYTFEGQVASVPGDDDRAGVRYRTRVRATATPQGSAGMHRYRSHEVLPLTSMPLAGENLEKELLEGAFPPHSTIAMAGSEDGAIRIQVNGTPWRAGRPDRRDNAPRTITEQVTHDGHLYRYRVGVEAFWQVHRGAPEVLVSEVFRRVEGAQRVLDLYAGVGLFSVPLAAHGIQVTSVESAPTAIRYARRNLHDHPHATVIHHDVRDFLRTSTPKADVAIVDPPRSGAGAATLEALVACGIPAIVYVACDPVALARDARTLARHGYAMNDVKAWDMFPMTHHVETIATFTREASV